MLEQMQLQEQQAAILVPQRTFQQVKEVPVIEITSPEYFLCFLCLFAAISKLECVP